MWVFCAASYAVAIEQPTDDGPGTAPVENGMQGVTYMIFNDWGGTVADAEKSPATGQDDLMCWAAAASNILEWTGLGLVGQMSNADHVFKYLQDHWTNASGMMEFAWEWWFDGTNNSQGEPWAGDGWAQVDVPGGGFYLFEDFDDYYRQSFEVSLAMSAIDTDLHDGYGVALGVYPAPDADGHALSCWGFNYDTKYSQGHEDYYYVGIWVTDSDDSKYLADPLDMLRFYAVEYDSTAERWFLQDFYGTDNWYIGEVQSLLPEPTTAMLLALGVVGFVSKRH